MAREIKDSLVMQRALQQGKEQLVYNVQHELSGYVNTKLDKVVLTSAGWALPENTSIMSRLESKTNFCRSDSPSYLELDSSIGGTIKVDVPKEVVNVLKAIAVEQISANQLYSQTLADIWLQIMKAFVTKQSQVTLIVRDDYKQWQRVVVIEVSEYLRKYLPVPVILQDEVYKEV